jgi:hypothetical protein
MKILILLGVFASFSGFSTAALATESNQCQAPTWVGTPGIGSDDVFHGTLSSDCTISGANGGGVAALAKYLVDQTTTQNTVYSGPTAENYLDLSGVVIDVQQNDASEQMQIRSDVHIAHDSQSRLEYASLSKDVQGQGDSQFVRKLDITVSIRTASQPGNYTLTITTRLDIKRPWYAPTGMFEQKAEQGTQEKFLKNRDATVPAMAAQL